MRTGSPWLTQIGSSRPPGQLSAGAWVPPSTPSTASHQVT